MPSTILRELQDLPETVAVGLSSFIDSALAAFGPELRSIIFYGSGAEGRLTSCLGRKSLYLCWHRLTRQADALREPFVRAAIRVSVMFLLEAESGKP